MSLKLDAEVIKWLEGIQTEVRAGSVLLPKSEAERAWNDANDRTCRIINLYKQGNGLFQI